MQSRYYNPQTGRFLNSDVVYDLDAGLEGYNLFLYCANDPVGRIDISGTDSEKAANLDLDDDDAREYGGGGSGSGTGSMIGDISYISNKDAGPWNCVSSIWQWLCSKLGLNQTNNSSTSHSSAATSTTNAPEIKHTQSNTSPRKVSNPNGSHTQIGSNGKIYSYAEYDSYGRQIMRIDFQGRAHDGVLPHIHCYAYPPRGNVKKFIFDMAWRQLK